VVRVPEDHAIGKIEQPWKFKLFSITFYEQARDPARHFVIQGVDVTSEDEWCGLVRSFDSDEALIFVHGFNNSFQDALYRGVQIFWDLKYAGLPVLFSWPSRSGVLSYGYDRDSALGARQSFLEVLSLVSAQDNIKRVHVLAHSMGNFVVLDALSRWQSAVPSKLRELLMAAPDVDKDHYLTIAPAVRKLVSGMTL
jgi:esterase/lipase superfamily enzyme